VSRYEWPGGDAGSGSPDRVSDRLRWLQGRYGVVPPETLLAARMARRGTAAGALQPRDRPSGTAWLWLPAGPSTVLGGQAESSPRVSGRVREIAVSPDGTRAYAATANGGVWYTADSGASWIQVGGWATRRAAVTPGEAAGGAEGLTFGSLLVAFGPAGDGSGDEVFAATGEIAGRKKGSGYFGGAGVLHARAAVPVVVADEGADPWTVEGGALLTGLGSYRLAADPHAPPGSIARPAHLLLGTSNGLFERTTPATDPIWSKVTSGPFGKASDPGNPLHVTDIRWIPKGAASRVWVGVDDQTKGGGGSSLWWADADSGGGIGTWTQVTLAMAVPAPGAPITRGGRIGLAGSPAAPGILYALSVAGPRDTATAAMWRIDDTGPAPLVASIGNVPPRIFESTGSGAGQQDYDLTIVADPAVAGQLIIGGAALEVVANDWNAALWRVQVQAAGPTGWQLSFTPPAPPPLPPAPQPPVQSYNGTQDPTFIGAGVHPDVHCAVWTTGQAVGARHVWIGCDGGIYRSAAEGAPRTFLARNTGVGSLEPGWIASNPASLHDIVIGTQDNGTIRRAGDTVWRVAFLGDGGGVTFFTSPSAQYVRQYIQAHWRDNGGRRWGFVMRPAPAVTADQKQENDASSFYSGAAATVDAGISRVAVGTNRVWCTQDGGTTFFTLPGGLDPKRSPGPNPADTATDSCVLTGGVPSPDGQVVTLRWATPRRLVALCQRAVLVHDLVGGTAAVPPTSTVKRIDGAGARGKKNRLQAGVLPPAGSWTDIAVANPAAPGDGTLYVATTGPETPSSATSDDTLWWYDGSAAWKRTGLRAAGLGSSPAGTIAPAYAVAVDPASPATVYVGTGAGVWQGTRAGPATSPAWTWQALVNGLPEVTVTDLEIVSQGGVRLLRATLSSAGVWELDLSGTTAPQLFLRVHDRDTRRVLPTPAADTATLPPAPVRFDACPDLRVRNAPGTAVPPPGRATLPMSTQPTGSSLSQRLASHELWVLQTAMHAHDVLVRPDGQWSPGFASRLLAAGAPAAAPSQPRITLPFWTAQLAAGTPYADPWDTAVPAEADLMELIVDRPAASGPAATGLVPGPARVDVLVHRRSALDPAAETPWVLLIRRPVTGALAAWAALPVPWAAAVTSAVSTGTAPGAPLGDSWQVLGAMQQPAGSLTARTPRAVTFAADFSAGPAGSQWLLVAVAGSAGDPPVIPAGTLGPAVMGSRHLACRSIRLRG
jgi:hypothetical protein